MSTFEEALRMLRLAIGRLEQARVDLADVAVIEGARADLERIMAALTGRSTGYVANPSLALRTVARALQPISEPVVRGAWADTVEAAMLVEDSTREWRT